MRDLKQQEDLILEAARLHQVPDWERLMEANITPALVIGGERRLQRGSSTATSPRWIPRREYAGSK